MFGIDDALIWAPMAGAALGAMTSKKALQGAALGGALGYGGAALPGLLGAGTAPAATGIADGTAASFSPMSAADFMKSQIASSGTAAPSAGLLSDASFKSAMDNYVKPIGTAMSAGVAGNGLLNPPQQRIQASPIAPSGGGGSASLAQLASQGQQSSDNALAQAAQERAARRKMYRGGV